MTKVKFYEPHDGGFRGEIVAPLPEPMLKIARELDGKSMTLEEAMEKINRVAKTIPGKAEIVERRKWISFEFIENPEVGYPIHFYRLIKYREV